MTKTPQDSLEKDLVRIWSWSSDFSFSLFRDSFPREALVAPGGLQNRTERMLGVFNLRRPLPPKKRQTQTMV